MKLYLACSQSRGLKDLLVGADILSAYPYIRKDEGLSNSIPLMRNFILDSGVFTMINSGKRFDLEKYVEEYAEFIKLHKIKQYVELDVDQIIGVEETRQLRNRLEHLVGWPSIPVWHTIRGKESFIKDCTDYNYIALGFFLTEGLKENVTQKYAKAFVNKAHELGCRIHGLGFTKVEYLKDIPFDSVDSSSWAAAQRFSVRYKFSPQELKMKYIGKEKGKRCINSMLLARPALIEWRKMQDYFYHHVPPIWE